MNIIRPSVAAFQRRFRFAAILTGTIASLTAGSFAVDHFVDAQPVTDINPLGDSNPDNITFAQNRIYFTAFDSKGRNSLYSKSLVKGSLAANDPVNNRPSAKIKALFTQTRAGVVTNRDVDNFTVSYNRFSQKETLYFHLKGDGLYVTRGSALSTLRLLKWNAQSSTFGYIDPDLTAYQGNSRTKAAGVVFAGFKPSTGYEPFITNGTPATTRIIRDIVPGTDSSLPYDFCALPVGDDQNQIIFGAYDPTDFYQLHRYKEEANHTFSLLHFNVARTDNIDNNLQTYPAGMTLAGNDVVFSAENRDLLRDVGLLSLTEGTTSFLTDANVEPLAFGKGSGGAAYFSANDAVTGSKSFWAAYSAFPSYAEVHDRIVGSFPFDVKTIGTRTYVRAYEGDGIHLYRVFGPHDSTRIKTSDNNPLLVDEYVGVVDVNGEGQVYIVGHVPNGQSYLWRVENAGGIDDDTAVPVETAQGYSVSNPSKLAPAVHLAGQTYIARVFFSCKGVGTEFENKVAPNGTTTPRGEEVWAYQPHNP